MPYRIDIAFPPADALDQLVQLGALDIETVSDGLAAILPDGVPPDAVAAALRVARVEVSPAVGRDNGSVWLLSPRAVRIGSVILAPPDVPAPPNALRLLDAAAFGTGHHPTTALCIETIERALTAGIPNSILDVGTGSGVLALTALKIGVLRATGVDTDADALKVAAENARLNSLSDRLQLLLGGPDRVSGAFPVVVANILAAPLIEMAPVLVRRVGHHGRLILSGIPASLESEVAKTYQRLGMHRVGSEVRAGWSVLMAQASW